MKKIACLFIFISVLQISLNTLAVLPQENEDAEAIKKVIREHYDNYLIGNLNGAMELISRNYSERDIDGNIIDYEKFKSRLKEHIDAAFERSIDGEIAEMNFYNLEIRDDKASVEIEFLWKGFDLDTLVERTAKIRRLLSLVKENSYWRIILLVVSEGGKN